MFGFIICNRITGQLKERSVLLKHVEMLVSDCGVNGPSISGDALRSVNADSKQDF